MKQHLLQQYHLVKRDLGSSPGHIDSKFFFNTYAFINSRDHPGRLIIFEIVRGEQTIARMCITLVDGKGFSPWNASFGSIECYEILDFKVLDKFVSEVLFALSSDGIKSLDIIHYPEFYDSGNDQRIDESFVSNGLQRKPVETNQHIEVDKDSFESKITYAQRKRLNKCIRAKFSQHVEGQESLREAYQLLTDSRIRKGYPVTMTYPELSRMFELHPQQYLLFTIRNQDELIAMAVSIKVSSNVLYNFYHADHEGYQNYSPTVMVVDSIYRYCQQESMDHIDLGISSVDGVVNEGLYNFKKGLGAIDSKKIRYTWNNQ